MSTNRLQPTSFNLVDITFYDWHDADRFCHHSVARKDGWKSEIIPSRAYISSYEKESV